MQCLLLTSSIVASKLAGSKLELKHTRVFIVHQRMTFVYAHQYFIVVCSPTEHGLDKDYQHAPMFSLVLHDTSSHDTTRPRHKRNAISGST